MARRRRSPGRGRSLESLKNSTHRPYQEDGSGDDDARAEGAGAAQRRRRFRHGLHHQTRETVSRERRQARLPATPARSGPSCRSARRRPDPARRACAPRPCPASRQTPARSRSSRSAPETRAGACPGRIVGGIDQDARLTGLELLEASRPLHVGNRRTASGRIHRHAQRIEHLQEGEGDSGVRALMGPAQSRRKPLRHISRFGHHKGCAHAPGRPAARSPARHRAAGRRRLECRA